MRIFSTLLFSFPLSFLALTHAHDAAACGGCLAPQQEVTQVTGHKMILSVSQTQTTLWDQITYSGNPSSFAWVLPIKGTVDVGLSSDALFQALDARTQVSISSPPLNCPPPPFCGYADGANEGAGPVGTGSSGEPPVTVLAQEVVGPYETVQLASTDPNALKTWLAGHNYNLPADVTPVVDAYVKEGFNFLALKLVPGQDVSAMRPVRVTTQGANLALPLRMIAAGTGAVTPITLWVLGEGRYETTNLSNFTIDASQLIWNWDTQSSNYATLQKSAFTNSQGKAWQTEAAEPIGEFDITSSLDYLVQADPQNSGYADAMGQGAQVALDEDKQALFGGINETALWITRLRSELSRAALANDLGVGASTDQNPVARFLTATKTTGTAPACPTYSPCDGGDSATSVSCAMTDNSSSPALLSGIVLGAALALSRRRRRAAV
jgi:MYXO-CTERM domain-containing protein